MATFAELKQLYTSVDEISGTAREASKRILNRTNELGQEASSASASRLEAIKAELTQLDADYAAMRDAFLAAGWNEKIKELFDGGQALENADEKASILKLYSIEANFTKSSIKDTKEQIATAKDYAKTNIEFRTKMLARSPQPVETPPAPTAVPAESASAPVSVQQQLALDNATTPASGPVAVQPKSEATAAGQTSTTTVTARGPRPNPLHAYPSYTYGLSLHLLTIDDFNSLVDTGTYTPKHVLVASAGRWTKETTGANALGRDPYFGEDFYFSELRMQTIIGAGEANRATNAIDMQFTLIEPYGITFLDRLLNASEAVFSSNYLDNPYLIQIDFFGTDSDGNVQTPIPNITKRIPIKILQLTAKLTNQGTEYKITAQPYNHQAFNESIVNTPVNVELSAATVNGYFLATDTGTADLSAQLSAERAESARNQLDPNAPLIFTQSARAGGSGQGKGVDRAYKAKSYADALNAYKLQLEVDQVVLFSDRYNFKFHPSIGESPMYESDKTASPANTPMADVAATPLQRQGNMGAITASMDLKKRTFPIQKGTSIESVIALIVRNSQYVLSQISDRSTTDKEKYLAELLSKKDTPVKWFKIIPKIKLKAFDPFTNSFAKDITYNIVPYEITNVRLEDAPQGKAKAHDAVKYYNYIYTGENIDILDVDLNFDAMYFTSKTAYPGRGMATSGSQSYIDTGTSCDVAPIAKQTITPNQTKYRHADQRQVAAGGSKTAKEVTASDLAASLVSMSNADMLGVDLTIVGDPEFIKQDDMFYPISFDNAGQIEAVTNVITPNGSIVTDTKEIFVELNFKTPVDIDDSNGLMKFDTKYRASGFSGLYRVMSVNNVFNNGKFTQTLELLRYPNQDDLDADKPDERGETAHWSSNTSAPTTSITDKAAAPDKKAPAADDTATKKAPPASPETAQKVDADLANVKASAPTETITSATEASPTAAAPTEPAAIAPPTPPEPPPPPPAVSPEKQALQSQISVIQSTISGRQNSIRSHQNTIAMAQARVARGASTPEAVAELIASEQAAIDELTAMIGENQSTLSSLQSQLAGMS